MFGAGAAMVGRVRLRKVEKAKRKKRLREITTVFSITIPLHCIKSFAELLCKTL
jgi:hypothetical protein